MLIAVEGCGHGELDVIYETLAEAERHLDRKVDLLLICGDFQAVRNEDDLACMACPAKYRHMNTFYKYYSGEKIAPVLTVFIGGNHEASNYLQELPFGGLVAPKIYYMGYAGVITIGDLKIAGLGGLFKEHDYRKKHYERPPYTDSTLRSVYHYREEDVVKLASISSAVDIFMSHEWPAGITQYGNLKELLQRKRFLRKDIANGSLGGYPLMDLLKKLKPEYFFAAHMHAKFPAIVPHGEGKTTRFLALSKPLPGEDFMQVIDLPEKSTGVGDGIDLVIKRDPEWLAIVKQASRNSGPFKVTKETQEEVIRLMGGEEGLQVEKSEFCRTARSFQPDHPQQGHIPSTLPTNPQTQSLVGKLDINTEPFPRSGRQRKLITEPVSLPGQRPAMVLPPPTNRLSPRLNVDVNPEEIPVDIDSDEDE